MLTPDARLHEADSPAVVVADFKQKQLFKACLLKNLENCLSDKAE